MSNQLRLLPAEVNASPPPSQPIAQTRHRRHRGPSAPGGRIDIRTRRAGRQGVADARLALRAATTEAE